MAPVPSQKLFFVGHQIKLNNGSFGKSDFFIEFLMHKNYKYQLYFSYGPM